MSLLAHHADAFVQIELFGRSFPDGMTEHALAFTATAVVLGLMVYGLVAVCRDLRRWRRRKLTAS